MGLEVSYHRSKSDVQEAILQFAARRGYRFTYPWHTEGPRIENRDASDAEQANGSTRSPHLPHGLLGRALRWVFDTDPPPRIDVTLSRKQGKTVVKIDLGAQRRSVELAYALKAYLSQDRAYTCLCPPICPRCGAPVSNVSACFCGRCGQALLPLDGDVPLPAPAAARQAAGVKEDAAPAEVAARRAPDVDESAAASSSSESSEASSGACEDGAERSPTDEERMRQQDDGPAADVGEDGDDPGEKDEEPLPVSPVEGVLERRAVEED